MQSSPFIIREYFHHPFSLFCLYFALHGIVNATMPQTFSIGESLIVVQTLTFAVFTVIREPWPISNTSQTKVPENMLVEQFEEYSTESNVPFSASQITALRAIKKEQVCSWQQLLGELYHGPRGYSQSYV